MKKNDTQQVTEFISNRYKELDIWPSEKILSCLLEDQKNAVNSLNNIITDIEKAALNAYTQLSSNHLSRLVYIGSGTSGRICVQDGAELYPTFGWPINRVSYLIAGGKKALFEAIENAEDNVDQAQEDMQSLNITANDVIIAVSASGSTPYTVECCKVALEQKCSIIGISSNVNAKLFAYSTHPLFTNTGPEPVAGSTRMNAGTAQKICLNMLSTLIMIKMGCVYDGMMVEFKLTNEKLKLRACKVLQHITQCDHDEAVKALDECNGDIKLAVLIIKGIIFEDAKVILANCNNNLREALSLIDSH